MTCPAPVPQSLVKALKALWQVARMGQAARQQAPSPTEPDARPPHLAAADRQLAQLGWPQASAYRVYSAGDSFCGREEILFVARDGRPLTAQLGTILAGGKRVEWLEVEAGW